MKKRWFTIAGALILIGVSAIGLITHRDQAYTHTLFALDTVVELKLYGRDAKEAAHRTEEEIYRLEGLLSARKEGSDIDRINRSHFGEIVSVSEETKEVLTLALDVSKKTNGCFEPTIKPLVDLWDIKNALQPPEQHEIEIALDKLGCSNVEVDGNQVRLLSENVQIDLGGIAKGYIGDKAAELVRQYHCTGILDLGGNIVAVGEKEKDTAWKVGIKDPVQKNQVIETVEVINKSVVTSGGYERYFEYNGVRYHHILNPFSGYPANSGLASVTVISADGALADALSTAIYVAGPQEGKRLASQFGVEVVLVDTNGMIIK